MRVLFLFDCDLHMLVATIDSGHAVHLRLKHSIAWLFVFVVPLYPIVVECDVHVIHRIVRVCTCIMRVCI